MAGKDADNILCMAIHNIRQGNLDTFSYNGEANRGTLKE